MGFAQLIDDVADAVRKNLRTAGKAASKNVDDIAKTGNKYVDEVAETLGKSKGNKVLDEAVYNMDDAVKKGKRAGKMKKADIEAKKAEIKARREARANGEEVKYSGNLGGVNEGSRNGYEVNYNGKDYLYNGKSWQQRRVTGGKNGAIFYEDVNNASLSSELDKKFLSEPKSKLSSTSNTPIKDYQSHNKRQSELESIWEPRTQEDLDKANRGWRQRTLDNAEEKVSNAWDHLSGNNRRRTTQQRRAYNQQVMDNGQGEFITSNKEYKRMQSKYGSSNADTPESLYENMINAQKISQSGAGEYSGINLGEFLENHPVIGLGGAAAGGAILANVFDDDDN